MAKELLEGEADVGGHIMTSREWASEVLMTIGEYAYSGSFPTDFTAFDFGRAIGRALSNCNDLEAYKNLIRGIEHYHSTKKTN